MLSGCMCRHWMHSEMWWPRLFRHHGEIAWDDYEKDYSDLPHEVLVPHKVAELAKDAVRQLEVADKDMREILQVFPFASCCAKTAAESFPTLRALVSHLQAERSMAGCARLRSGIWFHCIKYFLPAQPRAVVSDCFAGEG